MAIQNSIDELEEKTPRFKRLLAICEEHFGEYRVSGSHHVFKTPWPGDPRINLQKAKGGRAKPYQIKQVIAALRKLQSFDEEPDEEG